jgi:hypothetical protein
MSPRRRFRRSECAIAIMDALEEAGIKDYEADRTGKSHVRIRWRQNGRQMTICTSHTASDYRAARNASSHAKHMIRSTP